MQRTRIFVLKQDQDKVVALLQGLGAVQLEQADRASFFRDASPPGYASAISDQVFRLDGLVAALPPVPVTEKLEVGDVNDVLAKAREIRIDEDVRKLKDELENVDVALNRNNSYLQSLGKISGFDRDLAALNTQSLSVGFYSVPIDKFDFEEFAQAIKSLSNDSLITRYCSTKNEVTALVVLPKGVQDQVRVAFEKFGAVKLELPTNLGNPEQARTKIEEENKVLQIRKADAEKALLEISKRYYGNAISLREALSIENQRIEALGRTGQSDQIFVIEGWVPETKLAELESKVTSLTNGRAVLEKAQSNEIPPTLMQNSPRINYFEFFVRFFSLPKSEEIDPTWTLAVIFPIFFGMMLGDVGYGLVILILGYWFARVGYNKTKARWLPVSIRRFGLSLMPKRALGQLGKILIPSAIIGMIIGILTNAYFGFRLPFYPPVFDLIKTPQVYLIITLFVGLAHITIGYIYAIFIGIHSGHKHVVYSKIAWLGFMWSGVAAVWGALTFVLGGAPIPKIEEYAILAVWLSFGVCEGVLEGPLRFIMEIPSLMSHVVSYGRILGVLLASLLLGYIAATSLNLSSPVYSLVVSIIVLFMVTLLNVVLGIFEPAIQGIRLHYVEFYSKFFEGNGKRFTPFSERRQFTKKSIGTTS